MKGVQILALKSSIVDIIYNHPLVNFSFRISEKENVKKEILMWISF